jgi:Asp-tRNA(Asn)/Glu-tRNA(Gln) amidotransferase A subunit family amidase
MSRLVAWAASLATSSCCCDTIWRALMSGFLHALLSWLLPVQRVRAKILAGFEKTLKDCDVIMTPATATVAPALQQNPAGRLHCSLAAHLHCSCRYTPGNVNPAGVSQGLHIEA